MPKLSFKARYRMDPVKRFWMYVNKNGPIHPVHGQCWVWTGSFFSSGYGELSIKRHPVRAHRYSWTLHYGDPGSSLVCHKCDNKRCVNPDHLFLGSHSDNHADRDSKGRQSKGESVWHLCKFTEQQVLEIRERYENRKLKKRDPKDGIRALAVEFGVYDQAVKSVVSRRTWKHI